MKKVLHSFLAVVLTASCVFAQTILTYQSPALSTNFQYFGSPLDGTTTTVVANPGGSGNASTMCARYVKPAVAETWAGAFSNPNPTKKLHVTGGALIKLKVRMNHIGNVLLKLEHSTSGQPNWEQLQVNTKSDGSWETLTFDCSQPSAAGPGQVAHGTYERVVLFFDFGSPGTGTDVVSYFDDLVVSGGTPSRTVNFSVDMTSYAGSYSNVYLAGSFNGWCGNCNELTGSGSIKSGSMLLPAGDYEYKFEVDNWAASEQFAGGEPCTITDPSGQFVNRLVNVPGTANMTVPRVCWQSCYGKPTKPAEIFGPTSFCAGQAGVVYYVDPIPGADSYTWTAPTGATIVSGQGTESITVNYGTAQGYIRCKAVNACGISPVKSLYVTKTCRQSRDSEEAVSSFDVYPNPARGQVSYNFVAREEGEYQVSLIDMTGRLVLAKSFFAEEDYNEKQLSLENIIPGVYTFMLEVDGVKSISKLIVE